MNGAGDLNCNSFIRIQGGGTNPASGPGTVVFSECQFNQGNNAPTAWLTFANMTHTPDAELWQFDNCYVEEATIGIQSDASWTSIIGMMITNTYYNVPAAGQFLSLNAATKIDHWTLDNNIIKCKFTVAPTPAINDMFVTNCEFGGDVSITMPALSNVFFSNNNYSGALTIAGTPANCAFNGGNVVGVFTNSITAGNTTINLLPYNAGITWTPNLQFGGVNYGGAASTNQGFYQVNGLFINVEFSITLTNKGAQAGAFTISNLPLTEDLSQVEGAGGGIITTALNMSTITGMIFCQAAGTAINFYQATATGYAALTNANFNNTTVIKGCLTCKRAGL